MIGERVEIESVSQTQLKARLDDIDRGEFVEGSALESLSTSVTRNSNGIEIISNNQTQLESRLQDTENNVTLQAQGLEEMTTTVEQIGDDILVNSERIERVTASISGPGNLVPNAGFESDVSGWTVQTRGAGWAAGEMVRVTDLTNTVPTGTSGLMLRVAGTPTGAMGVRSDHIAVEELKTYIASAYLASENCTVRFEWRGYARNGSEVANGVIDQAVNRPGGVLLKNWIRSHKPLSIDNGIATVRLFLWAQAATGSPRVWLLRPMLEEAMPLQENPSPWVLGAAGLEGKYAEAAQTLRAEIEEVDGRVTANAEAITQVRVDVGEAQSSATQALQASNEAASIASAAQTSAGNASSSASQALQASNNVASLANAAQTTANGAQSTATQALTASQDNASAIISVRNQSTADNLFRNAEWKDRTNTSPRNYYTIFNNGRSVVASYVQSYTTDAGVPTGRDSFIVESNVSSPNTPAIIGDPRPVAESGYMIEPGATYIWSYYASGSEIHNARMDFYDANGNIVAGGGDGDSFLSAGGGQTLAQYARPFVVKTAPANARWAVVQFYSVAPNTGQTFSRYTAPMLERAKPGQTQPSPWSAGSAGLSSATFALQVAQDAQITLTTNVNGHVSGMVSKNDGQRGVISFLADVFEIIASGTVGVRFTRRNGGYFMRFYAASVQTILGINFGASNNMCFWYGPNIGEENCTKQNGTIWFDNAGSAYFKGAIIAGAIRNGGYTSSVALNTTYSEGPFGTNGGPISVNASYAFSQILTASNTTATYSKGAGSNQATLQLWRRIGSGALEMVAQTVATGSLDVMKDGDTPAQAVYAINGTITYTDTAGGTAQRTFEVRMLNRQQQIVNISGGATGNTQTSQATGIQTAEG